MYYMRIQLYPNVVSKYVLNTARYAARYMYRNPTPNYTLIHSRYAARYMYRDPRRTQRERRPRPSEGIMERSGCIGVYSRVSLCVSAVAIRKHVFSSVFSMYRASVSERDTCIKLGA